MSYLTDQIKEVERQLTVMKQAREGCILERRSIQNNKWTRWRAKSCSWDWSKYDYRIKPKEPRAFLLNLASGEQVIAIETCTVGDGCGIFGNIKAEAITPIHCQFELEC